MTDSTIMLAHINMGGNIDIQVHPSSMTIAQYAVVIAALVRGAAGLFVGAGEMTEKDAIDLILKTVNRESRNPQAVHPRPMQLN